MARLSWEQFEERAREMIDDFDEKKSFLLNRLGMIYQGEIKKKITETGAVDTGRLRASITVEKLSEDSVIVGTNVEYAKFVNDGHIQRRRFVPGRWRSNGTFEYIPNHDGGMLLRNRFVPGKKFMEKAKYSAKPLIEQEMRNFMEQLQEVWRR